MKYTFHIVDVFSSTPFGGNQLAVLPDAVGISTEGMQRIAREFNFGETTFVLPKKPFLELILIHEGEKMLRTLVSATIVAGALAGSTVCERSSTNPRGSFGPGEAYTAGNVRDFGYGTSSLCVVEIRC